MSIENQQKYQPYLDYTAQYADSLNAATGSTFDPNANVQQKNITTLEGEMFKKDFIGINRLAMHGQLRQMYGQEIADEYIRQLEAHEIYRHDETAMVGKPYCVSITLYPLRLCLRPMANPAKSM